MALIGRRRQEEDTSYAGLNPKLLRELAAAGERAFTGAVEVEDRGEGGFAKLYLWDGGLYAAELDGYEPHVAARLHSSGAVAGERWEELSSAGGDDPRDPRLGVIAVERGWIGADALAIVHQEYVMASLGAILVRPKLRFGLVRDEQTADYCTLPLPVEPLFGAVQRRARRTAGTWETLGVSGTPATVIPVRAGNEVPARLSMAEFTAMAEAVDGVRSLDAVAEAVGFTRAEGVHMAGLLALAGVIRVEQAAGDAPPDRLFVPEEYGRTIAPAPRRVRPPRVVASPSSNHDAHDVPDSEQENAAKDADTSEQIRQLRLEIATAERAELEQVLSEAAAAEREAVARTASLRARLRDAEETIDTLSDPSDSIPDAP